jgi:peptidyl-tRNA hydrolase, PTH1 family
MALFQRRPETSSPPLYTLGLVHNVLIVGLGNPGKEYDGTRHNIGFACIDEFARKQEFDPWIEKRDLKCLLTSKVLGNARVIAIKPTTFMNLSGEAVQAAAHFYKIPLNNILAVYDEVDIPFGQIRTRVGGESAGHNGVKSIIKVAGKDFGRVRVGIKSHTKMDTSDFVLAPFTKEEQEHMPALTKEVTAILTEYIFGDQLPHETRNFIV